MKQLALFILFGFGIINGSYAQEEIIYHNDFNSSEVWDANPKASSTTSAVISNNGKLILNPQEEDKWFESTLGFNIDIRHNFSIETSMTVLSQKTSGNWYGIIFGAASTEDNQFLIIDDEYLLRSYELEYKVHIDYTKHASVKTGRGAYNKLRIDKIGSDLNFYINDEKVASFGMLKFYGNKIGFKASKLLSIGVDYLTIKYLPENYIPNRVQPQVITATDNTPPEIIVTAPSVTRGLKVIQKNKLAIVAGKVTDESGIYEVMVNGVEANVDPSGNFSASIPLAFGDNTLLVTATDAKMNKASFNFSINRQQEEIIQPIETPIVAVNLTEIKSEGKYYALIIGIQDYLDETINDLDRPVADANSLYQLLTAKYTFDKQDVFLLKNPTRDQLFESLESLSHQVKSTDNLLIFYAGHGYWDENRKQGYWYPSDARRLNRSSWLTNADLKEYISAIKSKHTLLISDACFSGGIFKSRSVMMGASRAIKELNDLPSRKAMTSGTLKEVPDQSVFIEYLVKRLFQNTEKYLSAEQLFSSFRTAVINNSANGQVPQFGEIKEAGDEGGDFIFIMK